MIDIEIRKNDSGCYTGFTVKGHAGFANSGSDIVCSAVSMLVINTINSIEKFTTDKFSVKDDEKKGLIEFEFISKEISPDSKLLLDAMCLGLSSAQESYRQFIRLRV
ncbi:MAG: ribosomal-processing cysteine protease Prp [Lachnospiraceae bacterium]|nr:ribosomal-processing cysteine protease Prp [Lachnospiraceae bacterium]